MDVGRLSGIEVLQAICFDGSDAQRDNHDDKEEVTKRLWCHGNSDRARSATASRRPGTIAAVLRKSGM